MAVSQFVSDLFRCSHYFEKSKNNHANAPSVDEGHFDSVSTLHQARMSHGQLINTAGAALSRRMGSNP
jgi:hypothetical protein